MKIFRFVLLLALLAAASALAFLVWRGDFELIWTPSSSSPPAPVSRKLVKLAMTPPKTMNLISVHKTPVDTMNQVESHPYADFFIRPAASDKPPIERSGASFDSLIQVNGKKLPLRGVTIRKFEMSAVSLLTIYAAAFYIGENEKVDGVIADVEKVLILEYRLDVPKEKVVEAIQENVNTNPEVNLELVRPLFQQLSDAFDNPKKGDRYEFIYLPGRGTAMIKAGKVLTVIPTSEFEQAFFGIWTSPHGKDVEMRCELLALPCPEKSLLNPANAISSGLDGAKEKLGKLKGLLS